MSPEKANIFLIGNDKHLRRRLRYWLQKEEHTIPLQAFSIEEALEKVPLVPENGVNIAIIDDHYMTGRRRVSKGRELALSLQETAPEVLIVSLTSSNSRTYADVNIDTRNPDNIKDIGKIINPIDAPIRGVR
jgi:hypothetical protein